MLRWIVGGAFVAVMIAVWFLSRAIVDNFGVTSSGAWILGFVAIGFWIEHRKAIAEREK
jgi:hypothetical protein